MKDINNNLIRLRKRRLELQHERDAAKKNEMPSGVLEAFDTALADLALDISAIESRATAEAILASALVLTLVHKTGTLPDDNMLVDIKSMAKQLTEDAPF